MDFLSDDSQSKILQFQSLAAVAVVEPEFALNVGYLARSMANFGLKQLYIVMPKAKQSTFDIDRALLFSSHGDQVMKRAKFLDSMDRLRERFKIVVGTTAIRGKRMSNITRKTLGLDEAIPRILRSLRDYPDPHARSTKRQRTKLCFVFGRDTTGLTNEELQKCDYAITISTGTKYNTLNISHAAAILFFCFSRSVRLGNPTSQHLRESIEGRPSRAERERLSLIFQELAKVSDYQEFKRDKLRETITRMLDRSNPSLRELYLLMGLASKARRKIELLSRGS